MIYDRYYYSLLCAEDKQVYQLIYKGIEKQQARIIAGSRNLSAHDIERIYDYINRDNPHLFYVDFSRFTYQYFLHKLIVTPEYFYTKTVTEQLKPRVESILLKMLSRVNGKTEYEKELSVHDLLAEHVVYDERDSNDLDNQSYRSNSILGVLFYKTAVCEGIAKVTKYLLNALDVHCLVVNGHTSRGGDEGHAWNIVKINGQSYHLDVTWDICASEDGRICYDYFNLPDKVIGIDHYLNHAHPVCVALEDNYYVKNKFCVRSFSEIQRIIIDAVRAGKSSVSFWLNRSNQKEFDFLVQKSTDFACMEIHAAIQYHVNNELKICTIFWK